VTHGTKEERERKWKRETAGDLAAGGPGGRHHAPRKAAAKAKEIEDAVYGLKAANPHRKPEVGERTPGELLALIEARAGDLRGPVPSAIR
jgi:hypothetical protein